MSKFEAPSRRNCPLCGGETRYVRTVMGWITGFSIRKCESCGYVDPAKVKLYRGEDKFGGNQ